MVGGCGPQAASDPAEQVRVGWDAYRMGEWNQAVLAFEKARDATPPDSPLRAQALYGLATTWNLRRPGEDPALARQLYRQVADLWAASDEAAWSLLALARMKHVLPPGLDPDLSEVRTAYQEVIDRFPNHPAGHEAFVHQQATILSSYAPQDARQVLADVQAFIRKHGDSQFLSVLYSLMGTCYFILDEPERRLAADLSAYEVRELDPTNPNQDNTGWYWNLACEAEFEVADYATARKFYRLLLDEYPTDVRVYAAKQALKRMDEMEAKVRAGPAAPKAAAGGAAP
jgi:tetratricopeptide (TPR) repeat protein